MDNPDNRVIWVLAIGTSSYVDRRDMIDLILSSRFPPPGYLEQGQDDGQTKKPGLSGFFFLSCQAHSALLFGYEEMLGDQHIRFSLS